jgi:O-antigen ligase
MATEARTRFDLSRVTGATTLIGGLIAGLSAMAIVAAPANYRELVAAAAIAPWIIVVVGDIERVLVATILIDTWFEIDTNLAYRPDLAALGGVGGLSISVTTISVIALLLLGSLRREQNARLPQTRLDRSVLAFTGLIALSIVAAGDKVAALDVVIPTIQCGLVYFVLSRWAASLDRLLFVIKLLCLVVAGNAAIGALQIAGIRVYSHPEFEGRFSGLLASPNTFGALLALAFPLLLVLLLVPIAPARGHPAGRRSIPSRTEQQWRMPLVFRRVVVCSIVADLALLLATESRGAWLSAAIAGVVVALVALRRRWVSPAQVLTGPAVVAIALAATPLVRDRLTGDDNGSAGARVPLMKLAGRMISDHPLFGVGANNYVTALPRYLTPDTTGQWIYTVHNQFLLTWAESGPLAFAALVWLFVEIVCAGIVLSRTSTRLLACIGLGVAAAVCGHAAHMTIEVMNGRQQLGMLLILAALVRAAGALTNPGRSPW